MTKDEMIAEDDKKWEHRNIIAELTYCGRYIKDRKHTSNLDLRFYAWLCRRALKEIMGETE